MKTYQDIDNFLQWSNDEKDQYSIAVLKGLVMDATRKANSGHPGGPLSCADFAYVLYKYYLKFDPIVIGLYYLVDICRWYSMHSYFFQAG